MIRELRCESITELISAYRDARNLWAGDPWSRGHERAEWELKPSVWREFGHRPTAEMHAFHHFRNDAHSIRSNCPSFDDAMGWLMLMQHFGLPTRLLDWSTSLAVSGYFCFFNEKHFDHDGAIWLLNSKLLNAYHGDKAGLGVHLVDSQDVTRLAESARAGGPFSEEVFAVLPPQTNERLTHQRGVFTIHGGPAPLEQRNAAAEFLVKLVIPKRAKSSLADALSCLGVSRTNLFPDLDNLAGVIKESIKHGIASGNWIEDEVAATKRG